MEERWRKRRERGKATDKKEVRKTDDKVIRKNWRDGGMEERQKRGREGGNTEMEEGWKRKKRN